MSETTVYIKGRDLKPGDVIVEQGLRIGRVCSLPRKPMKRVAGQEFIYVYYQYPSGARTEMLFPADEEYEVIRESVDHPDSDPLMKELRQASNAWTEQSRKIDRLGPEATREDFAELDRRFDRFREAQRKYNESK